MIVRTGDGGILDRVAVAQHLQAALADGAVGVGLPEREQRRLAVSAATVGLGCDRRRP